MITRSRFFSIGLISLIFVFIPLPLAAQEQQGAVETLPEIIKRIQPSTVVVLTYDENGESIGQGSGFFVSQTGQIITNRHVLEGTSRAEVKTAQGKIYPITYILAEDKEGDLILASVDIPAGSVQPLKLSDSIPQPGQRIVVIGNPLGLEGTVSDGIVSAVRDIPAFGNIIQLSAPISAGSSGSPVVDMQGQVIAIATFQITEGQNLNFAIPSQRAANLKPGKPKTFAEWQKPTGDDRLALAEKDWFRGQVYAWREDYESALTFFEKAVEKDPQHFEAWLGIHYCNMKFGRHDKAIAALKEAFRIKPDHAEVYWRLGVVYTGLRRYAEAIEAYKQAIRIKPNYAEAYCDLGAVYTDLRRYAEAIEAYKQAIRIKPDYAKAHFNLGLIYLIVGERDSALEEYKILKDLDKGLADGLFNLIYK